MKSRTVIDGVLILSVIIDIAVFCRTSLHDFFSVPHVSPWCAALCFFSTRQIAYMQNKLITAGQLVVGVIRADVVRGVDSDVGTRLGPAKDAPAGVGVASLARRGRLFHARLVTLDLTPPL